MLALGQQFHNLDFHRDVEQLLLQNGLQSAFAGRLRHGLRLVRIWLAVAVAWIAVARVHRYRSAGSLVRRGGATGRLDDNGFDEKWIGRSRKTADHPRQFRRET